MYGSDILVAPIVYENKTSREVYLPKRAKWTNLHDGKEYDGGQSILVEAPLEVIPVFTRDNKKAQWIGMI